jgi:hypothetical protein
LRKPQRNKNLLRIFTSLVDENGIVCDAIRVPHGSAIKSRAG